MFLNFSLETKIYEIGEVVINFEFEGQLACSSSHSNKFIKKNQSNKINNLCSFVILILWNYL